MKNKKTLNDKILEKIEKAGYIVKPLPSLCSTSPDIIAKIKRENYNINITTGEWEIQKNYPYTTADLMARFGITSVRLFQFRNGPDRAKQLLFEGEDFIYEKTKIKYSEAAITKLEKYYEKHKK